MEQTTDFAEFSNVVWNALEALQLDRERCPEMEARLEAVFAHDADKFRERFIPTLQAVAQAQELWLPSLDTDQLADVVQTAMRRLLAN